MDALLLIDIQNDYFGKGRFPLRNMKKAAGSAAELLNRFRREKREVIHIRHIALREPVLFFEDGTAGSEINGVVSPGGNEKVFIKHYPSSFRDTGLHEYLQEKGIVSLHIAGAMTNMCVDTTVRAAFDLGYDITLYENACAAKGIFGTSIVHIVSIKTLGSVFAKIRKVGDTLIDTDL